MSEQQAPEWIDSNEEREEYLETLESLEVYREGDAYAALCDSDFTVYTQDEFDERYRGEWDSKLEFGTDLVDESGMLGEMPENIRYYFDYEAFTRDLFMGEYFWTGSYVFRSIEL